MNRRRERFGKLVIPNARASHYLAAVLLPVATLFIQLQLNSYIPWPELYFQLMGSGLLLVGIYGGIKAGITAIIGFPVGLYLGGVLLGKGIIPDMAYRNQLAILGVEMVIIIFCGEIIRRIGLGAIRRAELLDQSEKNLRYVINNISDFVAILTSKGVIIEMNEAALKGTKFSTGDMVGKKFVDCPWWIGLIKERMFIKQALEVAGGGEAVKEDTKIRTATGEELITDMVLLPVTGNSGRVIYIIMSAADVTARVRTLDDNRRLAMDLEREKNRIEEIVANVPGIVLEMTRKPFSYNQELSYISPYIRELLEYEPYEIKNVGKLLRLIHPGDRKRIKRTIGLISGGYKNRELSFRIKSKSGKYKWVELHLTMSFDYQKRISGIRGVMVDISDRKKLENRKDEFIGVASHELKTPLTTVKAFVQILKLRLDSGSDKKRWSIR